MINSKDIVKSPDGTYRYVGTRRFQNVRRDYASMLDDLDTNMAAYRVKFGITPYNQTRAYVKARADLDKYGIDQSKLSDNMKAWADLTENQSAYIKQLGASKYKKYLSAAYAASKTDRDYIDDEVEFLDKYPKVDYKGAYDYYSYNEADPDDVKLKQYGLPSKAFYSTYNDKDIEDVNRFKARQPSKAAEAYAGKTNRFLADLDKDTQALQNYGKAIYNARNGQIEGIPQQPQLSNTFKAFEQFTKNQAAKNDTTKRREQLESQDYTPEEIEAQLALDALEEPKTQKQIIEGLNKTYGADALKVIQKYTEVKRAYVDALMGRIQPTAQEQQNFASFKTNFMIPQSVKNSVGQQVQKGVRAQTIIDNNMKMIGDEYTKLSQNPDFVPLLQEMGYTPDQDGFAHMAMDVAYNSKPNEFVGNFGNLPLIKQLKQSKYDISTASLDDQIDEANAQIASLQAQLDDAQKKTATAKGYPINPNVTKEQFEQYKASIPVLEDQIKKMNQAATVLKDQRYYKDLNDTKQQITEDAVSAPDYKDVVAKGKNINSGTLFDDRKNLIAFINTTDPEAQAGFQALTVSSFASETGDTGYQKYKQLNPEEADMLRYLYAKGDIESFDKYRKSISRELDRRFMTATKERENKMLEGMGVPGKVIAGASSVVANLGSPLAYIDTLIQTGKNAVTGTYEPVNMYSPAQQAAQRPQELRQYVMEGASDFVKFLGNTGFSLADMATTLPFGPTGALVYMSAEAAGQASNDALQRGASPEQAAAEGTVYGAIEFVTEKLPIDNLFKIAQAGLKKQPMKVAVKATLKQAGIEGSEEWIAEIADNLTDMAVMGEKSQFGLRRAELIKSGMSEDEATKQAATEFFVYNPAIAFAGGALSGGVMGGGATLIGGKNTNTETPNTPAPENKTNSIPQNEQSNPMSTQEQNARPFYYDELGVKAVGDGELKGVDYSLAEPLEKINKAGYKTIQSHSAISTDYENASGRFTNDGYIAFLKSDLTPEQIEDIRTAAKKAGLAVDEKNDIFFSPAISVRTGITQNGTSQRVLWEQAEKAVAPDYTDVVNARGKLRYGNYTNERFDAFMNAKWSEFDRLVAENGGEITDDTTKKQMWNTFADGLTANTNTVAINDANNENTAPLVSNTQNQDPYIGREYETDTSIVRIGEKGMNDKNKPVYVVTQTNKADGSVKTVLVLENKIDAAVKELETNAKPVSIPDLKSPEMQEPKPVQQTTQKLPEVPRTQQVLQAPNQRVVENGIERDYYVEGGRAEQHQPLVEARNKPIATEAVQKMIDTNPTMKQVNHVNLEKDRAAKYISDVDGNVDYESAKNNWIADNQTKIENGEIVDVYKLMAGQTLLDMSKKNGDTAGERALTGLVAMGMSEHGSQMAIWGHLLKNTADGFRSFLTLKFKRLENYIVKKYGEAKAFGYDPKRGQPAIRKGDGIMAKIIKIHERADAELRQLWLQGKPSDEQIADFQRNVADEIADVLPTTFRDKWNAWRFMSMLGNPRSAARNFVSNTIKYGVEWIDRQWATIYERMSKIDKNNYEYAAGFSTYKKGSPEAKAINKSVDDFGKNHYDGTDKYEIDRPFMNNKNVFKNKVLKAGESATKIIMSDWLFWKAQYKSALGQMMKARGVSDVTIDMEVLASERADYATFRQKTKFSQWAARLKAKKGVVGAMATATAPFTRTPSNIALEAVDRSLIGTGKAIYKALLTNKTEVNRLEGELSSLKMQLNESTDATIQKSLSDRIKSTQEAIIDARQEAMAKNVKNFARNTTGMLISGLGFALAAMGLIVTRKSKDPEERKFMEQQGVQEYALQIPDGKGGNIYLSLDWAMPTAFPILIGAETYSSVAKTADEDDNPDVLLRIAESAASGIQGSFETFSDLSMLSGSRQFVTALADTLNGKEGADITSVLMDNMFNYYIGQNIPAILRNIGNTTDPRIVSTVSDNWLEGKLFQMEKSLPVRPDNLPTVVDIWGNKKYTGAFGQNIQPEEQNAGDFAWRLAQNFGIPATVTYGKADPVNSEIERLIATGEIDTNTVLPTLFNEKAIVTKESKKYFGEDGLKLTQKEVETLQVAIGKECYRQAYQKINSASYAKMDVEKQAQALADIYKDVKAKYKKAFVMAKRNAGIDVAGALGK